MPWRTILIATKRKRLAQHSSAPAVLTAAVAKLVCRRPSELDPSSQHLFNDDIKEHDREITQLIGMPANGADDPDRMVQAVTDNAVLLPRQMAQTASVVIRAPVEPKQRRFGMMARLTELLPRLATALRPSGPQDDPAAGPQPLTSRATTASSRQLRRTPSVRPGRRHGTYVPGTVFEAKTPGSRNTFYFLFFEYKFWPVRETASGQDGASSAEPALLGR